MKPWLALPLAAVIAQAAIPAKANDSIAAVRSGGLVLVRTDVISMESEDLYLSPDEVRVDYVFLNQSDRDVEATVAFPMPDIEANPWVYPMIPDPQAANFLAFTVEQDGAAITPTLQQRVSAAGVDYTDLLTAAGVPAEPYADATTRAIDALSPETKADWVSRGLLAVDTYDDGSGMIDHYVPFWTLATTWHWRTTFPAGRPVTVHHRYKPSVGGSVGLTFLQEGGFSGATYQDYKARYCLDSGIEKAVAKSIPADNPYGSPFAESHFAYVLMTGNNWAGPIKSFRLTVDKVKPDSLVSFCGDGVEKVGPTTFRMEATDFSPVRDLEILILNKQTAE